MYKKPNAWIMKYVIVFASQDLVANDIFSRIITNSNTINMFSFVFKAMSYNRVPPTVKSMGLSVYIQTRFVENNAFHGKLEIYLSCLLLIILNLCAFPERLWFYNKEKNFVYSVTLQSKYIKRYNFITLWIPFHLDLRVNINSSDIPVIE